MVLLLCLDTQVWRSVGNRSISQMKVWFKIKSFRCYSCLLHACKALMGKIKLPWCKSCSMESVRTKFVCSSSREAPVGKSVHVHHFHTLLNSGSSIKAELQSKEEGGAEKKDLLSLLLLSPSSSWLLVQLHLWWCCPDLIYSPWHVPDRKKTCLTTLFHPTFA